MYYRNALTRPGASTLRLVGLALTLAGSVGCAAELGEPGATVWANAEGEPPPGEDTLCDGEPPPESDPADTTTGGDAIPEVPTSADHGTYGWTVSNDPPCNGTTCRNPKVTVTMSVSASLLTFARSEETANEWTAAEVTRRGCQGGGLGLHSVAPESSVAVRAVTRATTMSCPDGHCTHSYAYLIDCGMTGSPNCAPAHQCGSDPAERQLWIARCTAETGHNYANCLMFCDVGGYGQGMLTHCSGNIQARARKVCR